ncbi:THAP-type domain-containing protein [Trichonephila inaurata madagascariensis]|uniref:THAP-type domain-containing protein n=1 Tax=Trichonephila inaurata madagascariensis TaxID=2747483 RepID=A0A8X6XJD4_9ARAC|nr:THAP-type domain-containing protein [Trichonephila inaurata madagascariensis]
MPFGMKNAGSIFQKPVDNALLLHRKYCRSYISDVAIYSTTWDEHLDHIAKSAVVNKNLFTAISNCKDLKYLCWGIIAEGEFTPRVLEMEDSDELTFEDLFHRLVALFPECRVEVKSVSRNLWKKFCSARK